MKINVQIGDVKHGAQIKNITVPDKMRTKIKTNIDFIDDMYGGVGLTPGTVTLFTGTPGAGKTTLLIQLAEALSKDIPDRIPCMTLYNTTEESLFQTKMVTERLFGPAGGSFFVGEDVIVDDLNPSLNKATAKKIALGKQKAILQHARLLQKACPDRQLFLLIDSLQAIDDGYYGDGRRNTNTPLRAMELLTNFAKETYAIVIVIGQVNKSGEFAGKQAVKHAIDCHMHLKIDTSDKSETQGMRIFEMQKNRYGYSGRAYVLNVGDAGLYEVCTIQS